MFTGINYFNGELYYDEEGAIRISLIGLPYREAEQVAIELASGQKELKMTSWGNGQTYDSVSQNIHLKFAKPEPPKLKLDKTSILRIDEKLIAITQNRYDQLVGLLQKQAELIEKLNPSLANHIRRVLEGKEE